MVTWRATDSSDSDPPTPRRTTAWVETGIAGAPAGTIAWKRAVPAPSAGDGLFSVPEVGLSDYRLLYDPWPGSSSASSRCKLRSTQSPRRPEVKSPIQSLVQALRAAVFDGQGVTSSATRRAAAAHAATRHPLGGLGIGSTGVEVEGVPIVARGYIDKVGHAATRVTDDDFSAVQAEVGDDAVFELTVAAAVGAGLYRYERVLDLLSEEAT